jgi:hypothetical protein
VIDLGPVVPTAAAEWADSLHNLSERANSCGFGCGGESDGDCGGGCL